MTNDPYNNGIPKYSTAQNIDDALCALIQTEEMDILSEMGMDVSWEGQTYYYTDRGSTLKEDFDRLSDCGGKMWLLDLAIKQINFNDIHYCGSDIHNLIYDALIDTDLAKRIGFKKLFVEKMLGGYDKGYNQIIEAFADDLSELHCFDSYNMMDTFQKVAQANNRSTYGISYPNFCFYLKEKVQKLHLIEEAKLITECRAHLTAYDDFIFGLRINQALYEQCKQKMAALDAAYNEKLKYLYAAADRIGLHPTLTLELQQAENHINTIPSKE